MLIVPPAVDHPSRSSLDRLTYEFELRDELGAYLIKRANDGKAASAKVGRRQRRRFPQTMMGNTRR